MYIRPVHAELNIPALHAFIRDNSLGLFTTAIKHPSIATIQTSHIPWVLDADESIQWADVDSPPPGSLGVLRGHIARANPQAKVMIDAASHTPETAGQPTAELNDEVLVLFNSPVHSYVSPRYYKETKPDTGKVVPTWNYSAVQVYGRCRIHHSGPSASDFLQKQVMDLTNHNEPKSGGNWKVSDAPERYVDLLKKGIIGIEITIERIEGRYKMSQEITGGTGRVSKKDFRPWGESWARLWQSVWRRRARRGTRRLKRPVLPQSEQRPYLSPSYSPEGPQLLCFYTCTRTSTVL